MLFRGSPQTLRGDTFPTKPVRASPQSWMCYDAEGSHKKVGALLSSGYVELENHEGEESLTNYAFLRIKRCSLDKRVMHSEPHSMEVKVLGRDSRKTGAALILRPQFFCQSAEVRACSTRPSNRTQFRAPSNVDARID